MNTRRIFIFSVLFAMLSVAGGFLPANAEGHSAALFVTAVPTPRLALKTAVFDLRSVNTIPPSDIINQVFLGGLGGGGDICDGSTYTTPTLTSASSPTQELMVGSYMEACGWSQNEALTGSVRYPDGRAQAVAVEKGTSNGFSGGGLYFKPGINDPAGKYTLIISGYSGTVYTSVYYSTPRGGRVYVIDDYRVLLYGFFPSESVRLFYYLNKLAGWQEYTMGTDGRLEIMTSMKISGHFIAIGKKTGEVMYKENMAKGGTITIGKTILNTKSVLCANGLPSRVKVGDKIRAAYTDGTNLKVRAQAGFNGAAPNSVREGTKMTIIDGPQCAGGSTWWKIETANGIRGWVAEYWNGTEYLIEPAP